MYEQSDNNGGEEKSVDGSDNKDEELESVEDSGERGSYDVSDDVSDSVSESGEEEEKEDNCRGDSRDVEIRKAKIGLPSGWIVSGKSKTTGRIFYGNTLTDRTQYERPTAPACDDIQVLKYEHKCFHSTIVPKVIFRNVWYLPISINISATIFILLYYSKM